MLDLLDEIGIGTLIIIVLALGWLLRKIVGSKSYNEQLREEMKEKMKVEYKYSTRDKNNRQISFAKFDVVLTGIGNNKIKVIEVLRSTTGLGFKEAMDKVDSVPCIIKSGVSKEEAERIKIYLEEAGGTVGFR